ncbi:hypothetical protein Btru_038187 [Bulinus truncatus]|nr:hypothetical protein Btru_038187 [Bulinus truncatus]
MGRGGPPGRGIVPGRSRGLAGMEPSSRGGPPRRALLPHPSARGSRGGYGGPLRRDEYYDDEANGYQEEYYETQGNGPYAEEYEEQYPEAEDYYTRDRPEPPRNRGGIAPRGRGRLQPPDEYGYSYEEDVHSRLQAPAQRRNMAAGYLEEEYEESVPQIAVDPYERPRIRAPSNAAPPVRGARGGAVPSRRGGLLGNDPYSDESGRYDSVSGPTAGPAPGYEVESYGDSFGRRPAAPGANRMRPTPPADVYTTERIKPKPQPLMAEMVGQRRGIMGAPGHYLDNYQSANAAPTQGRDAFPEARRPPVRRDPYSRVAAETDDYVSYPPTSQGSAELSRKRHIDPFEEELPRGGRREFEEYRSAPIAPPIPLKRDRLDRNVYSSRQKGAYRGL